MNQNLITPVSGIPPLHQHGAFDDLDAALWNIQRLSNALRGIGNLLQSKGDAENFQLNMARCTDASDVLGFFGEVLTEYREIAVGASERLRREAKRVSATNECTD